jgi:hypothetical protein
MPYKKGRSVHGVVHVEDVYKSSNVYANNVPIALWDTPGATSAIINGTYYPDNPYQASLALDLIAATGQNGPHDDPDSTVVDYGGTDGSLDPIDNPITNSSTAVKSVGVPIQCGSFKNPVDYNESLSTNYTIKDLSIGTLFAHNIVAQNGLTVPDILCNLKGVCENILEPLRAKYPGFKINSGFRKGTSPSQHNKGMAVDVQWSGQAAAKYTEIAEWIRKNLPFDQLIFEHGNSIWLHISYNRTSASQRGQTLTYYTKVSPNYQPGITNYYA